MGQSKRLKSICGTSVLFVALFTGILSISGFSSPSNEIIDDSIQEFTFGLVQLSSATHETGHPSGSLSNVTPADGADVNSGQIEGDATIDNNPGDGDLGAATIRVELRDFTSSVVTSASQASTGILDGASETFNGWNLGTIDSLTLADGDYDIVLVYEWNLSVDLATSSFTVDTVVGVPGTPSATELADGFINAAEEAAGFSVSVDVSDANFAAGDTVELLQGGVSFAIPKVHTLTAGDLTIGSISFTVSTGDLGADGAKSLTAQSDDTAGNSETSTANNFTLDTQLGIPGTPSATELADGFINAAEEAAGFSVSVDVSDANFAVGDTVELLLGGASFTVAKVVTLDADDLTADSISFTVSTGDLGADGAKPLTAQSDDTAGNSETSTANNFTLDTQLGIPGAPGVAEASDGFININEDADNYDATVDVSDANFAAGDTVELLQGGVSFAIPKVHTLTASDLTAGSITFTILSGELPAPSLAGDSHTLSAKADDAALNTETGAETTFTVDLMAPTATLALTGVVTANPDTLINDAEDGGTVTATTTYDERMKLSTSPGTQFTPDLTSDVGLVAGHTLAASTASWNAEDETTTFSVYVANFIVDDIGVEHDDVDVAVGGATDLAGNDDVDDSIMDGFDVDTLNPQIALATLTILSNNARTDLATAGDTITISFTATEDLSAPQAGDVTIQGEADNDVGTGVTVIDTTPEDSVLEATLLVDASDTEGVTNFSIQCRDLAGNLCDPDQTTPNVPELATNLLTTDASEVIIDNTAPNAGTLEIVGTTTGSDTANLRTLTRDVQLTFDCDDSNPDAIDKNGALDSSKVAGCAEANVSFDGTVGNFAGFADITADATNDVELTAEHGIKTVMVQYRDFVLNTDDTISRHSDTINLDAFFDSVDVNGSSDETGEWEDHEFTVSGLIVHPQFAVDADQVLIDFDYVVDPTATFDFPDGFVFPDALQIVSLTPVAPENDLDPATGTDTYEFSATSQYPRPSRDTTDTGDHTHTPEATLVDSASSEEGTITAITETISEDGTTEVDSLTAFNAVVLERPTEIILEPIVDPFASNFFSVRGILQDINFPTPIPLPDRLIAFDGNGADSPPLLNDLDDVTTSTGVTIEDSDGIEITADNIAHLKQPTGSGDSGATIQTPSLPGFVSITFVNMELKQIVLEVTDGSIPPNSFLVEADGVSDAPFSLPLSDPDGISKVEVKEVRDLTQEDLFADPPVGAPVIPGATVDISNIRTTTFELEEINNINFPTAGTVTSILKDEGLFFSQGQAQSTEGQDLEVNARFDQSETDPDYLGSVDNDLYNVEFSNTAGIGGTATVLADNGKGIASLLCAAGDDVDGDAICDSWETTGVPYVVAGQVRYLPLPGASTTQKDVFVEIDYMDDGTNIRIPDPQTLTDVATAFSPTATIHFELDEAVPFRTNTNVWLDFNPDPLSDFNDIKLTYFGTPEIHSTITGISTQTNTVTQTNTSPNEWQLTITGLSITTPLDPRTGDDTRGQIILQARLNTNVSTDITVGPSTPSMPRTFEANGFFHLQPNVAYIVPTGNPNIKIMSIVIDYSTIHAFGNDGVHLAQSLETITIPITLASPTASFVDFNGGVAGIQQETQPSYPRITSNLEFAYSQVWRYILWANSFGGPSGQAEDGGNDAIVTLGQGFSLAPTGQPGGNVVEQSGTLAHELGHLLGLRHGGPGKSVSDASISFADSTVNCKPLYPSVMSYSRQLNSFLGSDWVLSFSDGSHGGNPIDPIGENTAFGGLRETSLDENSPLPGSQVAIVWGTPTSSGDTSISGLSDGSNSTPTGTLDWNGDGIISSSVSADINNFGISGCLASGPTSTPYYDYDDLANLDYNFRDHPSGQFDGITILTSDIDPNQRWQSILNKGTFDGLEDPPAEDGSEIIKAGSGVPIKVDIRNDQGEILELPAGFGHVFVSMDPDSTTNGNDPRTDWVQITDNQEGGELMRWVQEKGVLELVWKTPKNSADFGFASNAFSIEGTWYIRVVLFDPDNPDDDPDRPLAGKPNDATSDFLIDNVLPHIPDVVKDKATMQITITKGAPSGETTVSDPIIDPIIAFVNSEEATGNIHSQSASVIRQDLDDAKKLFAVSDPMACSELEAISDTVTNIQEKKIDPSTRSSLLEQLAQAETDKGC